MSRQSRGLWAPGTTKTPAPQRPLFCEVVKPLPKREVVAEAPELVRLIVSLPKRLVVTEAESPDLKTIAMGEDCDITVWGVVSHIIHRASS